MAKRDSVEEGRVGIWAMFVISVLGMAGALGLALLLIPQLSVRAAVRGGTIAIGMFLATMLGPRIYRRFRQRSGRG